MRAPRVIRELSILATLCLLACQETGPTEQQPWIIVLERVPTAAVAAKKAEQYRGRGERFERTAAMNVRREDESLQHLVALCGFASEGEARSASRILTPGRPNRLQVLDGRRYSLVDKDEASKVLSPDGAERLEMLARWMPAPGAARMKRFLLIDRPGGVFAGSPRPFGRIEPARLSRGFAELGFEATGEAQYSSPDAGSGQVLWLVGGLPAPADDDLIRRVYQWLLEFTAEPRAAEPPEEASRIRRQKKGRRGALKAKGRKPAPAPPEPPAEPRQVPEPMTKDTAWGPLQVIEVNHIHLGSARNIPAEGGTWKAWLGLDSEKRRIWLMVFNDEKLLQHLLTPDSLSEPTGLVTNELLVDLWPLLPEVPLPQDRLAYVGAEALASYLPRKIRNSAWAKEKAENPVSLAGYRRSAGPGGWQMSFVDFQTAALAAKAFDEGWVSPRQLSIQSELRRKKLGYDLGVTLKETGDVQAWWLRGAARGRLQEVYFVKKSMVWLFQASISGPGALDEDELASRLEMLPIWETEADD